MQEAKATQCDLILEYIGDFGSITPLEAIRDLGVYRLASRISDLKKKGYHTLSEWETVPNRRGKTTNIKRYSLRGDAS